MEGDKKWHRCGCKSAQKLSKHRKYQKARQLCAPHYLGNSLIPLLKCDKNCSLPCRSCPRDMALQEKWLVVAAALPVPASIHPPGPLQPSGELSQGLPLRHHIPHGTPCPKTECSPMNLKVLQITAFIANSENALHTFKTGLRNVGGFILTSLLTHTHRPLMYCSSLPRDDL